MNHNNNQTIFNNVAAQSIGIHPQWLINFLNRLEKEEICIHSAIVARGSNICMETYYEPYNKDTLHRMFSITKSLVSIGIGLLIDEGRISIDDHIVDYFPEKQPPEGAFPYTAMLTIKDMLMMRTCHNSTTYKAPNVTDWVGSFFTTKPSHVPGTNFSYDTSSTHILAALIEKLTGMELLDYLRFKFLDEIGFSKDAYILKDPNGVSMGGSGLCATPFDVFKILYLIANNGLWQGKQLLPEAYIKEAVKLHSDPYAKQGTIEEMQGYGYQIWRTRNNGFALYGMGGQLAMYVPDKDIYMVTTADTQGRGGGIQFIYDAFWQEIYDKIDTDETISIDVPKDAQTKMEEFARTRKLLSLPGGNTSSLAKEVNDKVYVCDENSCGVSEISVHFNMDKDAITDGTLTYTNRTGTHKLDFKYKDNAFGVFPDYNMKYGASGAFRTDECFLIKVHIIDSAVGNMYLSLNFKDSYITVMFRKVEESLFNEYNGVFSGIAK